jgi:hypothetical protein
MFTHARAISLIMLVALVVWVSGGSVRALLPVDVGHAGWGEVGGGSASGGGISGDGDDSCEPTIAIAPDGTPYVAWTDRNHFDKYDRDIYIRRWNGSVWEEVGSGSASDGGISGDDGYAFSPAVAIAPDGTPYIAWANGTEIYIRRWNGSVWEEVGAGSASGGGVSNTMSWSGEPVLAIAPGGTPYVAWADEESGHPEIFVRRWNGSVWEEVGSGSASGGGISGDSSFSYSPSIAISLDGTPCVSWTDYAFGIGAYQIYVRCWNGSVWEEVGAGSASGGGISNTSGGSSSSALAIAPDGMPYIAWQDGTSGDDEVYIRRWNGSVWEEVGVGSAGGGGISDSVGSAQSPALAIAPDDDTPYVAWTDEVSGTAEIYVRRWNEGVWEEIESGSAGDGGISDTAAWSAAPALAVAWDGTPYAAWEEFGLPDQVFVRQGPPAFDLAPVQLLFLAEVGGIDPRVQRVAVGSTSDVITWTAVMSPTVGWLSIAPMTGTSPSLIVVTPTISGLSVDHYVTQIVITGEPARNSPKVVDVRLVVVEEIYNRYFPFVHKAY